MEFLAYIPVPKKGIDWAYFPRGLFAAHFYGEIQYVVLSVFDDMGEDYPYYAVAWDDFAISHDDDFTQTGTLTGTGSQPEAQTATQTGFQTGVLLYEEDTILTKGERSLP